MKVPGVECVSRPRLGLCRKGITALITASATRRQRRHRDILSALFCHRTLRHSDPARRASESIAFCELALWVRHHFGTIPISFEESPVPAGSVRNYRREVLNMGQQDRDTRGRSLRGTWDDQVKKDPRDFMELAPSNTFGDSVTFELVT
jgi:hypothetical protein